ncbi:MAG: 4Fe-4S cluster-binding domain-containing protein, partial [Acutalibacteraceae bacterium]
MGCHMCPRNCFADRKNAVGFCGVPEDFVVARAALHFWEEPCISGKNGSGTVFFSGCNLRCVYCQNYKISHDCFGKRVSDKRLAEIFDSLIEQGAENINLVNPTHYASQLARVLKDYHSPVPVVYNSSGYESVETLKK